MLYLLIFIILFVVEFCWCRFAAVSCILDRPGARSSSRYSTPRGGGIVFLISLWLGCAFFGLDYPWFMAALTLISAVSFADDLRSLSMLLRLFVQTVAVALVFVQLGWFTAPMLPFLFPMAILCVGVVNACNFMDGINGMTVAYSLSVLAPLVFLNACSQFIAPSYLYVAALSLMVFGFFNFRPRALCFAGDVGSISMALILLFALLKLAVSSGSLSCFVFMAVYGVDTVLTIIHRLMLGENIAVSHRKHAYQLMANELHIPHLTVSLVYAALQLLISAGAIFLPFGGYVYFGTVIAVLSVLYILFMRRYYRLHAEQQGLSRDDKAHLC